LISPASKKELGLEMSKDAVLEKHVFWRLEADFMAASGSERQRAVVG
jgi:hypothetical protein